MIDMTDLNEAAGQLNGLLADPHPGLSTWVAAVTAAISRLAEVAGLEPTIPDGDFSAWLTRMGLCIVHAHTLPRVMPADQVNDLLAETR
jgi:hypothetical protein